MPTSGYVKIRGNGAARTNSSGAALATTIPPAVKLAARAKQKAMPVSDILGGTSQSSGDHELLRDRCRDG
jgi:hypothetical protein